MYYRNHKAIVRVRDLKFTRYVNMNWVRELAADIDVNGLLSPLYIFQDMYIITGNSRAAALDPDREIEVIVMECDYEIEHPLLEVLYAPKKRGVTIDPFANCIDRK